VKLDEIARLAGVSRTTASYVINGKARQYRVSDKTVEKVMAVVREHNYHPNAVAAGLRAGRTRSIGLVIPDLENTSYTRIANYLERQARQRGYQLLIACSEDQPENEMRCIEHLLQRQVDAIIVSTSLPPEHPFYQRWINDSLPIIALWTVRWIVNILPVSSGPIRTMPRHWLLNCVSSTLKMCCSSVRYPNCQ